VGITGKERERVQRTCTAEKGEEETGGKGDGRWGRSLRPKKGKPALLIVARMFVTDTAHNGVVVRNPRLC